MSRKQVDFSSLKFSEENTPLFSLISELRKKDKEFCSLLNQAISKHPEDLYKEDEEIAEKLGVSKDQVICFLKEMIDRLTEAGVIDPRTPAQLQSDMESILHFEFLDDYLGNITRVLGNKEFHLSLIIHVHGEPDMDVVASNDNKLKEILERYLAKESVK